MKMILKGKKQNKYSGQILTEYIVALVVIAFIALSCLVLFSVFSDYGFNVRKVVGIDSP